MLLRLVSPSVLWDWQSRHDVVAAAQHALGSFMPLCAVSGGSGTHMREGQPADSAHRKHTQQKSCCVAEHSFSVLCDVLCCAPYVCCRGERVADLAERYQGESMKGD